MNHGVRFSLLWLLTSCILAGCPDPQTKFNQFTERRQNYLDEVAQMNEGGIENDGQMGGEMDGITENMGREGGAMGGGREEDLGGAMGGITGGTMGGMMETPRLPSIQSGSFYFALAPALDPTKPMVFLSTIEISIAEDGQSGIITNIRLDPRTCEDRQVSAEGEVVFEGESQVNIEGDYSIDFGQQAVPGAANCISGSPIQATIQLQGRIMNEDQICGQVSGMLMQPFEYDLEGSTFAAYRVEEGVDLNDLEIKGSCDDL